jgi:hypothetical protein
MAAVTKIDSNATGLRYAEEDSLGVLPGTPIWVPLEPNEYDDFGGEITTIARNPINASRQRKKGVVTDLDSSGGFTTDVTQTNLQDLLQGFFFASFRRKGEELVTAVDLDTSNPDEYEVAATAGFIPGSLIQGQNFTNAANNAVNEVVAVVEDVSVEVVDGVLTVEASPPADAQIVVVGHAFNTDEVDVVVSGALPVLENTGSVAGTEILTVATVLHGDTMTINGRVYTFQDPLTDTADNIYIGSTDPDTVTNIVAAIMGTAGEGTLYGTGTEVSADATAVDGAGNTVDFTAIRSGVTSNLITFTEDTSATTLIFTNGTFTGGVGTSWLDLGLVEGEWIFVGGDAAASDFLATANNGWKRIRSIADTSLELDKSDATMTVETSSSVDLVIYLGRVLKNEQSELIVRRSYNLERQLGAPDGALPSQIQAEYVEGAVPGEMTINIPTAEKLTAEMSFIGTAHSTKDGPTALKTGTRPALTEADAFNTSSDFSRIKLATITAGVEAPESLFAFAQEIAVSINNNLSPNKAVGTLGSFEVTAGTFEVSGEITAYFASVDAVASVQANDNITLDFAIAKANAGWVLDLPLIALGDGRPAVEQDEPITLPLTMDAATAALIDPNLDYTTMMVFFDYLPTVAE